MSWITNAMSSVKPSSGGNMDPLSIGIMGGSALVGGAMNLFGQGNAARVAQEQLDYNKWAQQVSWNREDNAVQRRVADLRAAGLSPTLAAGSAAQSMSPISVGQRQPIDPGAALSAALQPVLALSQLRQTAAQTELTKEQARNTEYDMLSKNFHDAVLHASLPLQWRKQIEDIQTAPVAREKMYADINATNAGASMGWLEFGRSKKSGQRSGSLSGDLYNTTDKVGQIIKNLAGSAAKYANPLMMQQEMINNSKNK